MASEALSWARFASLEFNAGGHPVTRLFSQRFGAVLAWLGFRLGLSPNQLTVLACLTSLAGALALAVPGPGLVPIIAAIVLTQSGYAFDCADGQLARATRSTSPFGGWLDVYLDMLTVVSLAFAAVYRVSAAEPALAGWATVAGGLFCFARAGGLFTSTLARGGAVSTGDREKSLPRKLFLIAIDTPVVLFCVCALGNHPLLLVTYLAAISAPYTVHSFYVGIKMSKRPT